MAAIGSDLVGGGGCSMVGCICECMKKGRIHCTTRIVKCVLHVRQYSTFTATLAATWFSEGGQMHGCICFAHFSNTRNFKLRCAICESLQLQSCTLDTYK